MPDPQTASGPPATALYNTEIIQKPDQSYPTSTNAILALLHDPLVSASAKRGHEFIDELRTHIELETLLDKATYRMQVAHRALYKVLLAANSMTEVGRGRSIVDETLRKLTSETIGSTINPDETERVTMETMRTEMRAAHSAAQIAEVAQSPHPSPSSASNNASADSPTIAAAVYRASINNRDPIKLVGALAAKFPENSKFSGTGEPTLADVLNRYADAISEMNLTPTEQKQYGHLLLKGEAKRFYDNHIRGFAATFADVRMLLQKEYETPVKQHTVLAALQSLRVPTLVRTGMTEAAAIQSCYDSITKNIDGVPKEYRAETHKCEFLRTAVLGCGEWSNKAISDYYRLPTSDRSLARLHQDLTAALSVHNEATRANARDRSSSVMESHPSLFMSSGIGVDEMHEHDTWYHNERYSGPAVRTGFRRGRVRGRGFRKTGDTYPTPRREGHGTRSRFHGAVEPQRSAMIQSDQCFRCGRRGHYAVNCPNDAR
jgi:Zinc knuckle